jgi:hypothetical protein
VAAGVDVLNWTTKRQSGYGGFPSIFLTFSLLLLVLAVGFVVGRVVVARFYLSQAPKFAKRETADLDSVAVAPEPTPRMPGRVYVPPPAPPEEPPEESVDLAGPPDGTLLDGDIEWPDDAETIHSPVHLPAGGDVTRVPVPESQESRPERRRDREDEGEALYSVQVGVFSSIQGARRLEDELREKGHSTRIEVEGRDGDTLYRVLIGSYRTEYAARRGVEDLRRQGFEAFLIER